MGGEGGELQRYPVLQVLGLAGGRGLGAVFNLGRAGLAGGRALKPGGGPSGRSVPLSHSVHYRHRSGYSTILS